MSSWQFGAPLFQRRRRSHHGWDIGDRRLAIPAIILAVLAVGSLVWFLLMRHTPPLEDAAVHTKSFLRTTTTLAQEEDVVQPERGLFAGDKGKQGTDGGTGAASASSRTNPLGYYFSDDIKGPAASADKLQQLASVAEARAKAGGKDPLGNYFTRSAGSHTQKGSQNLSTNANLTETITLTVTLPLDKTAKMPQQGRETVPWLAHDKQPSRPNPLGRYFTGRKEALGGQGQVAAAAQSELLQKKHAEGKPLGYYFSKDIPKGLGRSNTLGLQRRRQLRTLLQRDPWQRRQRRREGHDAG